MTMQDQNTTEKLFEFHYNQTQEDTYKDTTVPSIYYKSKESRLNSEALCYGIPSKLIF